MIRQIFSAFMFFFISTGCSEPLLKIEANGKAEIYGKDNRVDLYQIPKDSKILDWARSTAFMVQASRLTPDGPDHHVLTTFELEVGMKLCDDVELAFTNQPMTEGASSFLVGPDLVATAGHYTKNNNLQCEDLAFIFDFAIYDECATFQELSRIPNENIYHCSKAEVEIYTGSTSADLIDYALFRLTERVKNREFLELELKMPQVGQPVMAIGHGLGLPTKVATGVTTYTMDNFFFTDMDLFYGNSGSMVLNPESGRILGIAVGAPGYAFPFRIQDDGTVVNDDDRCREFVPCPEQPDLTSKTCWGNVITPSSTFSYALDLPEEDNNRDPTR